MKEFKRKKACRKCSFYLKIKGICICVKVMIGLEQKLKEC